MKGREESGKKNWTLLDVVVLLALAVGFMMLALPNMALARKKAQMHETVRQLHSIASALEASRIETVKDLFISRVNGLNTLDELNASTVPWLVPEFLGPCKNQTVWGGRIRYQTDSAQGDVWLGAAGPNGADRFNLTDSSGFYRADQLDDLRRGVVFLNGAMVVGPDKGDD